MAKGDKRRLAPRLRFPEFNGQTVREVQLKDVTAESTTRNGEMLSTTSVMGVKKVEGVNRRFKSGHSSALQNQPVHG